MLSQKFTPDIPAALLFLGGTPELAQFTQGLEKQARQRYIVTLADINLQDEPPSPHGLARFVAARCTFEVLNNIDDPLTRQSALTGFQSRTSLSIGGFRVNFDASRRSGGCVTQSLRTQDGRPVG